MTGWLHNPSWTLQLPVVGFTRSAGFEARVAQRRATATNSSPQTQARSRSPASPADAGGNGTALYGYVSPNGNFFVKRASSTTWMPRRPASQVDRPGHDRLGSAGACLPEHDR